LKYSLTDEKVFKKYKDEKNKEYLKLKCTVSKMLNTLLYFI